MVDKMLALMIITVLSLGLLMVNVFRFNVLLGAASAFVSAGLVWQWVILIMNSDNPTMSSPYWIIVLAEIFIALADVLAITVKVKKGKSKY